MTQETAARASRLGRVGTSLKAVVAGLVIFWAAFPLLHWNEGNAVASSRSTNEGVAAVASIAPDKVDSANEGKLVHLAGEATTTDLLTDPVFGIQTRAIKLQRQVEMYQWEEQKHTETSSAKGSQRRENVTMFIYPKVWSDRVIFSGDFQESKRHPNPSEMKFAEGAQVAKKATLGAFTLSSGLVDRFNAYEPLTVEDKDATNLPKELREQIKVYGGMFYQGEDPEHPEVGDTRIRFLVVKPGQVSVIAKQAGNSFAPFYSGEPNQPKLELLKPGEHSAERLFKAHVQSSVLETWGLRGLGFGMLWLGAGLLFKPLSAVGGFVPYFADLLGLGGFRFSALAAAVFWLITVGFDWIGYRPIVGFGMLLGAAACVLLALRQARKRRAGREGTAKEDKA